MYKAHVRGEWQAVSKHERPGSALFCMLLASGWPSHVIPCKLHMYIHCHGSLMHLQHSIPSSAYHMPRLTCMRPSINQ